MVCAKLGIPARKSLVIEDLPSGVEAALAAGLQCFAVTTSFTWEKTHAQGLLQARRIVDDPAVVPAMVRRMIESGR